MTAQTAWYVLYGAVSALAIWYRLLVPLRLNMRHRMQVESVVHEAPGIVSVLIKGRKLHRTRRGGGQFFRWRFLATGCGGAPIRTRCPPRPGPI